MAVTSTTRLSSYTGNASTVAFPTGFYFLDAANLVVKVDGVTKTLGTDYTVSGAGNQAGGTVTFTAAPASGAAITIERTVALTQDTAFRSLGFFSPSVHEDAFDHLTMVDQQQQALLDPLTATDLPGRATALEGRATSLESRATAVEGRATALETRATNLETHDTSQDATVSNIDGRVSALELGNPPPPVVQSPAQGTPNSITSRVLPQILDLAAGSSVTASAILQADQGLLDWIASLLAHGGLLDVTGTWSAQQTFSQPVKFGDGTAQATAAQTLSAITRTYATSILNGNTDFADFANKDVAGRVGVRLTIQAIGAIAADTLLVTLGTGLPGTTWLARGTKVSAGVTSFVDVTIDGGGHVKSKAALAVNDTLEIFTLFPV